MKKTLTVNLNNIVFHIDDDAYEMLQTYLSEIAEHFKSDEEKREIMADIEARIAELFTEKLQKNKNVVNLTDVQEIIEVMGKPSQYTDEEEDAEAPKSDKKQQKSRRFYRDPENAMLGGIAGGLAAYFGWDVTLIRILFVVLVFLGMGFIIPVYIVVWLVAPQAITASQRLEMQGEDVTVDSIKAEMNNVKNYMESDKFKQSATSMGVRMGEVLRWFFKILFGFLGAVLGLVGMIIIGVLITLLFVILFEPDIINGFAPDLISNWAVISPENMVLFVISLLLIVGCPIFMLIYWAIRVMSGRRDHSRTAPWVVFILWLAGLFMFYSIGAKTFIHLNRLGDNHFSLTWSDDDSPRVDEVRNIGKFNAIDVSGNFEIILNKDSSSNAVVSAREGNLANIVTRVENGVLYIYTEKFIIDSRTKVYLSVDSIQSIVAKGACEVDGKYIIGGNSFLLKLTGASKANLDLNISGTTSVDITGASVVDLKGSTHALKIDAIGASKVDAEGLISKDAWVKVNGASHARVYASESIDAKANGASQVNCKGNPKKIMKDSRLGSSIDID
jgi:phage shock protein PspC (stress-responsive transcriptional regulator)